MRMGERGGASVSEENKAMVRRMIGSGRSAKVKVKLKAGAHELYCPVDGHKEKGMEGTVTVEEDSGTRGATDAERSIKGPV